MRVELRTIILVILVFGSIGTLVELLFLGHDEDTPQFIPLVLLGSGLIVTGWNALASTHSSLIVMRIVMAGFIAAGGLGIGLHYKGSMEFQREIDPSVPGFEMFMKVMQSKAPPTLAPGVMAQLGLLGLAYTYRHPKYSNKSVSKGEST